MEDAEVAGVAAGADGLGTSFFVEGAAGFSSILSGLSGRSAFSGRSSEVFSD